MLFKTSDLKPSFGRLSVLLVVPCKQPSKNPTRIFCLNNCVWMSKENIIILIPTPSSWEGIGE